MARMRAPFISFEGGEGCGKSTQIQLLETYLKSYNKTVCVTREPGGTEGAEELRSLLLNGAPEKWDAWTELLLNTASRQDHITKKVIPMLEKGTWVLTDRYTDSSRVYQGLVGGVPLDKVDCLQFDMLNLPKPDLTFLLDIDVREGFSRVEKRHIEIKDSNLKKEDRYERKGVEFHEKVRKSFLYLSSLEPKRFVVLNASQGVDEVFHKIKEEIDHRDFF